MAEKECIEREAAIKKLDHFQSYLHTVEGTTAIGVAKTLIEEIPAADVRPVVRGKWLPTRDDNKKECSECHVIHLIAQYPAGRADWCPNCGAMMEES